MDCGAGMSLLNGSVPAQDLRGLPSDYTFAGTMV